MDNQVILIENDRLTLERLSGVISSTSGFTLVARYQHAGDALGQSAMFKRKERYGPRVGGDGLF